MRSRGGLIALITADIVSAVGSRISVLAIPWLVLITTGSPAKMGLVAAAEMIPYLITGIFATPLADRFGLRRTSVCTDIGSAVAMAAIAAVPQLGFGSLLLLVAVIGALRGVGDRVKHALIRPMAELAGAKLIRVTSSYEGLSRGATLLGAPLAGVLIAQFGVTTAIWIDAATFAICAVIVLALVRPPAANAAEPVEREPYLTALRGGFRYLREDHRLTGMVAIIFALNVFSNAGTAVFIPLWVNEHLHDPNALGFAVGAFAAGALIGNILFTAVATRLPLRMAFVVGALISGAPRLFALGLSDSLVLVCAISLLSGVGLAAVNPVLGAMLYERVPVALQTRVIGLVGSLCFAGLPIGALLAGEGTALLGLTNALLVAAGICLVITLIPIARWTTSTTEEVPSDPQRA
ncbi:MFS transporter [Kribbella sp. NBC_01245]|uniref:MFS transporter n=1 Tax=Kribbella sp. NBC_01245 TaxID=2903578 RepID=UPI002E2C08F7|nr:MFS transporter [Kribbella sp. NBC_01245]